MNDTDSTGDNEVYAIVQVMGHKTYAGRVSKDVVFATLRIDIPKTTTQPAFTKEIGAHAIFDISYVSREVAERTAEVLKVRPIAVYAPELITATELAEMKARKQLSSGDDFDDEDNDGRF